MNNLCLSVTVYCLVTLNLVFCQAPRRDDKVMNDILTNKPVLQIEC